MSTPDYWAKNMILDNKQSITAPEKLAVYKTNPQTLPIV
jgi:hypothetical protein